MDDLCSRPNLMSADTCFTIFHRLVRSVLLMFLDADAINGPYMTFLDQQVFTEVTAGSVAVLSVGTSEFQFNTTFPDENIGFLLQDSFTYAKDAIESYTESTYTPEPSTLQIYQIYE